jgi:hypothetical protein
MTPKPEIRQPESDCPNGQRKIVPVFSVAANTLCTLRLRWAIATKTLPRPVRSDFACGFAAGLQHMREMRLADLRMRLTVDVSGRGLPESCVSNAARGMNQNPRFATDHATRES